MYWWCIYSGKYAGDMALVARLNHDSSDAQYQRHIDRLAALFYRSFLKLKCHENKGNLCWKWKICPTPG